MKYNGDYVKETYISYKEQFEPEYDAAKYEIDIPDGFVDPPILEFCKFLQDMGNLDLQDKMARYCLNGRQVAITLDGEKVGSFQRNNFNDAWEVFPFFSEHPTAYKLILDVVVSWLAKKSKPPRSKTSNPAAAVN